MRIAVLQGHSTPCDIEQNMAHVVATAEKAKKTGADLVLTPELFLSSPLAREYFQQKDAAHTYAKVLEQLAKKLHYFDNIPVIIGAPNLDESNRLVSAAFLLQDKQATLLAERNFFAPGKSTYSSLFYPGNGPHSIKINHLNFLIALGDDLTCSSATQHTKNIDAVLHLTARSFSQNEPDFLNCKPFPCPIISANLCGMIENIMFEGKSMVLQNGKIFTMPAFEENLGLVDIKKDMAANIETAPTGFIQSSFDKPVDSIALQTRLCLQIKHDKMADIWQALVLGTKNFIQQSGFSKAVFGLSGGIDSALVLCIAAEALGAENIHGALLPSPYSSTGSIEHSLELAKNLGVCTNTIPIASIMQAFSETYAKALGSKPSGLGEENMQARIRGDLLMLYASTHNALLLTTGNKSELATGYCTLYGDMAGALAVIGDLYKTQVVDLCTWYNDKNKISGKIIPEIIITKPPSAELRPDQLDSDSLPDYAVLDNILKMLLDEKRSERAIIEHGFEPNIVKRIIRLLHRSEFKRRQAAPVLCLSHSCFGTHVTYPL